MHSQDPQTARAWIEGPATKYLRPSPRGSFIGADKEEPPSKTARDQLERVRRLSKGYRSAREHPIELWREYNPTVEEVWEGGGEDDMEVQTLTLQTHFIQYVYIERMQLYKS